MKKTIWRIEKLVPGGEGMARLENGALGFVASVLPGELVSVTRQQKKKGFVRALALELEERSNERVAPPCNYAQSCGGCDWLHVASEAALEYKAALIAEALTRTGGLRDLPKIVVEASPRALGYRVRIRVHIDEAGRVGFFAHDSRRVVAIDRCVVARPELERALGVLRDAAQAHPELARQFCEAELRVAPGSQGCLLRLRARADAALAKHRAAPLLERLAREFTLVVAGVDREVVQEFPLSSTLSLSVPSDAFVQVNWEVNLKLVGALLEGVTERKARRFLDVYAGAGNFTLPLAELGLSGVMVESHASALSAAARTLAARGFSQVRALNGDAHAVLRELARALERFDVAVLDPPRAGARELGEVLLALAPRFIAYCACDPVTLARDLSLLVKRGYRLVSVRGFDMFPGTHHVETLAWLELESEPQSPKNHGTRA